MKKVLGFFITFLVGLAVFVIFLQIVGWARIAEALSLFLTWQGGVIVFLTFLVAFVGTVRWRFVLRGQEQYLSFWEAFKLWLASSAVSYFTPIAFLGGETIRAIGLKKIKNSSWEKSIVSVGIDRILDVTLILLCLIAGLITFAVMADFPSKIYAGITWGIVGILFLAIFTFYLKRKEGPIKWLLIKILGLKEFGNSKNGKTIFEMEKGITSFFSLRKADFWKGIGLSFLKYGASFLRITFLFYFISKEFYLVKGLGVFGLYNLSLFFPTPMALGSLEGVSALGFTSLGYNLGKGIIFAFLCRGADLILACAGFFCLVRFGFHLLGEKILKWIEEFGNQKDET